jgi:hypothetical protein
MLLKLPNGHADAGRRCSRHRKAILVLGPGDKSFGNGKLRPADWVLLTLLTLKSPTSRDGGGD